MSPETLGARPSQSTAPPCVPGFDLLEELGRGGMGMVYRARQHGLNRVVALKMIISNQYDDRLRFLAEAEAIAAIQHPNVVQVFEFGVTPDDGRGAPGHPYLAMEHVAGGSLATLLANRGPLPAQTAADLVEQIARGIQVAHELGIVHRDLKPANILLSRELNAEDQPGGSSALLTPHRPLVPKVSDFGIAKRGGAPDLTLTGVALGTPAYMSPEQARGETRFVGPPADIHALGVILFECLTGTPPYQGDTPDAIMFQVMRHEPPPVRARNPAVPRDLDLICLKCLAKKPTERYASAASLADDLKRHLGGEPVSVRPPGALEKVVRWTRRHPTRATAYAMTVLVAGLFAITSGALGLRWRAEEARQLAEEQTVRAETAHAEAAGARDALDYVSAVRAVDLAFREYEADNPARARDLLDQCPPHLRAWEWRYVDQRVGRQFKAFKVTGRTQLSVATDPDGKWVAVTGERLTIWDTAIGTSRTLPIAARFVAPHRDGAFAVLCENEAIIIDAKTGAERARFPLSAETYESHPDGTRGLIWRSVPPTKPTDTYGGEVVLWDTEKGAAVRTFRWPAGCPLVAKLSPSGDRVAVCGYHVRGGIVPGKVAPREPNSGAVRVFDTATGIELVADLAADAHELAAVAWSADGTRLVTGSTTGQVKVWDAVTGKCVQACARGSEQSVWAVGFSPDGARVIGGGMDRSVRVWDVATGRPIDVLRGHSLRVWVARFMPDGTVVTAGEEGAVRFWRIAATPPEVLLTGPLGNAAHVTVSNDGRYLATADTDLGVRVWDIRTGGKIASLKSANDVRHLALSSDGTTVAIVGRAGSVREWNWKTGTTRELPNAPTVNVPATHPGDTKVTLISADGRQVATSGADGTVRVGDATTGAELFRLPGHTTPLTGGAFSPDGTRLVTVGREGWLKVWDTRTKLEVLTVRLLGTGSFAVGWSADGTKLVTASGVIVRLFDAGPPMK